jgi:magnesium-transporting ATPase (P-type)
MSTPPRGGDRLFGWRTWLALGLIGLVVGVATLAALAAGRAFVGVAQTMAFGTLALSELALVFGLRSPDAHAWQLPRNDWLTWSTIASAALVAATVYVPWTHAAFATRSLEPVEALVMVALALVPLVAVEAGKALRGHRRRPTRRPARLELAGTRR